MRKGLILKTSCLRGLKSGKERTKVFRKVKRLCAEIVIDKPYFRLMMNGRKNYVIDRDRSALRMGRLLSIKEIAKDSSGMYIATGRRLTADIVGIYREPQLREGYVIIQLDNISICGLAIGETA